MTSAQAIPASNRPSVPAADVTEKERTGSARGSSLVDGVSLASNAIAAMKLP